MKSFARAFSKARGFLGQSPEALSAESEIPLSSISAGGEICRRQIGEPSPGVPLNHYSLAIAKGLFAFDLFFEKFFGDTFFTKKVSKSLLNPLFVLI